MRVSTSNGLTEDVDQASDLRRAAARKNEQHGQIRDEPETLRKRGTVRALDLDEFFDQRMPDIGAGRTAEPRVRLGLERQQRQDVIHVGRIFFARPGRQAQTLGLT